MAYTYRKYTGIYPQNRRIGYVRVSTVGQTLDNQLDQLRGAGCPRILPREDHGHAQ